MKILYISVLSSEQLIERIHKKTQSNPGFAVQKFSRLLVKGFISNGEDIVALTNPPISLAFTTNKWFNLADETEDGVNYKYIPFFNFPILKHFCIFIYSFFYVLFWGLKDRSNKAIVCDVLSISACSGSLFASKINRIKSVGIVTDFYSHMIGEKSIGINAIISNFAIYINKWYISSFSLYVLLTEAMNRVINTKHRPFIVMEALCDNTITDEQIEKAIKTEPKTVMYAGGIEEKYGIKMLVEAFMAIRRDDIQLLLFGSGSYVGELMHATEKDHRIKYVGVVNNSEVVKAELSASLLVNPRLTNEEFTKYSFPSKNMEYMVSGTPLLTTKLPGMPEEYNKFVYHFENETIEGFSRAIETILNKTQNELKNFGKKTRYFVLQQKNNKVQAKRIISLINNDVSFPEKK